MNILITKEELDFIDELWVNPIKKKYDDREYETVVLDNEIVKPIVNKLLTWFEEQSKLKLKTYDKLLITHRYNKGNFFSKHSDDILIYNKNRAYVVGFHINDDYTGGDYVLYNSYEIIDKTPGVPYYFDSKREHEVKPIIDGVRKSALIFINHEELIKNSII